MRIVIAGATGFVGAALCRRLREGGHIVVALTRSPERARARLGDEVETLAWPDGDPAALAAGLSGAEGVVNLAGENLAAGRWTASRKRALVDSRLQTTTALVQALSVADPRPAVLVSASAVGYYGDRGDESVSEQSDPGNDFLANLCQKWEAAAAPAAEAGVRLVRLRIGVVLGPGGGALSKMLLPFRLGLGGPLGSGRQWFSWIHRDDLTRLVAFCLENPEAAGAVNGTAPNPVTNAELSRALGKVLHRPAFLPAPAFALRLALGEMSAMLLTGQRVLPEVALRLGFSFDYPDIEAALRQILAP